MNIHPKADFRYCLLCGSNIILGPGRVTSGGRDSKFSIRCSRTQAGDIGALTHTVWRPANLCKMHEGFLIDWVDIALKGTTVLIEFRSELKDEAGSTKLLIPIIFRSSCGCVANITPIIGPVLDLIGDSSEGIAIWRKNRRRIGPVCVYS